MEQMYLATILGHEAYRDGFITGQIDLNGNLVTEESSFDEFKAASIARIQMGDRISKEYDFFYNYNRDFALESFWLNEAEASGDYSWFDGYLLSTYDNERDNFLRAVSNGGDHQDNYQVDLLNSANRAIEINNRRLEAAFVRYVLSNFPDRFLDDPAIKAKFYEDSAMQKQYGYVPIDYETIYKVGCMFMSLKYAVETIIEGPIDTLQFNEYLTSNGFFVRNKADINDMEDLLSPEIMAKAMTHYTQGMYTVSVSSIKTPSLEQICEILESETMYLGHLRIQLPGSDLVHSVMVSEINFDFDDENNLIISTINVANPLKRDPDRYGRQSYTMGEIVRWDFFKVIPTGMGNNMYP